MALIGYARVSTDEQTVRSQLDELRAAGCTRIHEEHASGGSRARPVLAQVLRQMQAGDVLVVVRLDRLARSLSHLLEVLEGLEGKGAHFRSLNDPVDTTNPQGKFALQVLGAAAELERAIIRARTTAGLKAARTEGRVGGNPALRRRDPDAVRRARSARRDAYVAMLTRTAEEWLPTVRRLRPHCAWEDVARVLNANRPQGRPPWTVERLVRAVKTFVREGLAEPALLERAPVRNRDDHPLLLVAGIVGADPEITLQGICDRLEELREPTPRGRRKWAPSSVRMLIGRARAKGLLPAAEAAPGSP